MLRTLWQDLRRAIISRRFLLAVMGAAALYVISAYDLGLGQAIRWGNKRHLLDYLGDAQTVALMDLLPFAAVIPFGAGFAEDWEFHAHHYLIARTGSRSYRLSKIVAGTTSGGFVMAFSMLLFLLAALPFSQMETGAVSTFFPYMGDIVREGQWVSYFSFQLALAFIYGALWASASMLLSVMTASRSMIFAVPVLFNGVLNRIAYLLQVPGLYAVSFGMVEAQSPLGAFMLCSGILLIPTLIFAILFLRLSKRRLKDA